MNRSNRLQGTVTRLTVRGFRSLECIEGLSLSGLSVLIGANGAGKSNFIRFFEMLSWMLRGQKLQEFVLRNGEGDDQLFMGSKVTPSMDAEIRLETSAGFNDYRFTLSHVAGNRLILEKEAFRFSSRQFETESDWIELPMPSTEAVIVERMQADQHGKTAAIVVNLLKNCATYQFHDTSAGAQIKMPWDVEDNLFLRSNGGNLAPILLRLQSADIKRYKLIVRQIARVLPFFGDFVLEPAYGKVKLRWTGKGYDKTFGPDLTSDGSLRLFCLLTLLNLPGEQLPDVLFLDEPELGLHPHAITLIAEMIKRVAQSRQVFLATQSPYMVDCFELENIIVADAHKGATRLRTMPQERYQRWLDDEYQLSDLWLKEIAGGVL